MIRKRGKEPNSTYHCLLLKAFFLSLLSITSYLAFSQDLSGWKTDTVTSIIHPLDAFAESHTIIVPDGVAYSIKMDPLRMEFDTAATLPIIIYYRVISPLLRDYPPLYDISKYDPRGTGSIARQNSLPTKSVGLLSNYPDFYKAGAITRGITVGNRQNLYVNSVLNLQIQGEISEDLMLSASITDQNIPFQPEGNTQQLRDFDNVLIELQGRSFTLSAGDIVIKNPDDYGYFLKYYKNQQGFKVTSKNDIGASWQLTSTGSIAIAKGKFATRQITPIEGVQGPYRLRGNENERFITILANSEKIFLDGELLTRGFDQDYVIDYNLGEITFTSRVVITRFSRIRVDYEYAQQYYTRSNLLISEVLSNKKHRIYLDYYRSADNPDRPLQFNNELSINEQLSLIGDPSAEGAFVSNISEVQSGEPGNYYMLIDTLIDDNRYSIYSYEVNRDNLLRVVFSEVGIGKGNYIVVGNNAYGRVFQWVPPIDGIPQGRFEPIQQVITPQSQEMFVIGSETGITRHLVFKQELGVSRDDKNLYANIDDGDNGGLAWRGELDLNKKFENGNILKAGVAGEFNESTFRPIDRFRTIEFDRDWSYPFPFDSIGRNDHFLEIRIGVQNKYQSFNYRNLYRNRTNILEGWQHHLNHHHQFGVFHYDGNHFLMTNEIGNQLSTWRRSFNEAYLEIDGWQSGLFLRVDQNAIRDQKIDSITNTAMYYREQGVFVRSAAANKLNVDLSVSDRDDARPIAGELEEYTKARQGRIMMNYQPNNKHKLSIQGVYRQTLREDSITLPNDNIIQGGLQSQNTWWQNAITHQLNYQTQNSRELRREFIYTQGGAGQGTHTWRDENNNGFAELDEFYEAINQDERNYIRLFVPTDEYIEAYQTNYQHTLNLTIPSQMNISGWLAPIKKLSVNVSWNIVQKVDESNVLNRINPYREGSDSTLLMRRANINYGIFYNRNRPGFGWSISQSDKSYKQLNFNGFELDDKVVNQIIFRYNFTNLYLITLGAENGNHLHSADFLNNRNFQLYLQAFNSELSWTPTSKSRFTINYSLRSKWNTYLETSDESVNIHQADGSFTWIDAGKRNVNFRLSYSYIDFVGEENTYLGYVLLEALRPGNNYQLNVSLNQNLKNGLQLSANYFGRKSEGFGMIHTGSMNLTAFF